MSVMMQLVGLQSVDSKLDKARKRYAEIKVALQLPDSLKKTYRTWKVAAGQVEHWQKEQKERHEAVASQRTRIEAQNKKLYGGSVKDAREQVALANNIESLKKHLDTLEESELEAILSLEQAQSDEQVAEQALAEAKKGWETTQQELLKEKQGLLADARKLKKQREQSASDIDEPMLKRYEVLRKKKGGVAIAKMKNNSCSGCAGSLPTATIQKIQRGDQQVYCPICGRMLAA